MDVGVGFVNYNHVSPHVLAPTDGDSPLVALRRPIGPLLIQNPDSSSHGLTAVPIAQVNPDQVQGLLFGVVHREFGRQVRAAFTVNVDDLPARVPPAQRQGQGRLGDAVGSVDQDRVDPDRVAHLLKVGEAEPDVGDLVHAPVQVFQVLLAGLALVRGQLRVQDRSDCLHVPVQEAVGPSVDGQAGLQHLRSGMRQRVRPQQKDEKKRRPIDRQAEWRRSHRCVPVRHGFLLFCRGVAELFRGG